MPKKRSVESKSSSTGRSLPKAGDKKTRPPIVTIMGHVDHGKTTLLDAIRESNVTASEFGGITQHINAYKIKFKGRSITFIDTPGHEAFIQMRAQGGEVADIVVLVVAADDSVMPQTKEAISHAGDSKVPIIVAINKVDLKSSNVDKVKRDLQGEGIQVEDFGGDIVAIEISAKEKKNLDLLLDMILLVSEMLELKDTSYDPLKAVVIESRMEQRRGAVGVLIIKQGILKKGGEVYLEGQPFKIKYITDEFGREISKAYPSDPVYVLGFKSIPKVGSIVTSEKEASMKISLKSPIKSIINSIDPNSKVLNIILKADTNGTKEAIVSALLKIKKEDAVVNVIYANAGNVNESDIQLAEATGSVVLSFNVGTSPGAEYLARYKGIEVNKYNIIYELISDIKEALSGILSFEESKIKGTAKVKKIFSLPSGDLVAGVDILAGKLKISDKAIIVREEAVPTNQDENPPAGGEREEKEEPIYRGKIKNLKQGKESVSEVEKGSECGVLFKPQFKDIKKGDIIEVL